MLAKIALLREEHDVLLNEKKENVGMEIGKTGKPLPDKLDKPIDSSKFAEEEKLTSPKDVDKKDEVLSEKINNKILI